VELATIVKADDGDYVDAVAGNDPEARALSWPHSARSSDALCSCRRKGASSGA